jgi:hypothetical protein
MSANSRRAFFDEVGGGMMAAALGPSLAAELGLAVVRADEAERGAGRLAPLCDLERGGDLEKRDAHPSAERVEEARKRGATRWIGALEEAIRGRDQASALHSEKYYRTVRIECAAARPGRRNRYLAALARVTASAFGFEAPGVKAVAKLLG